MFVFFSLIFSFSFFLLKTFPKVNKSFPSPSLKNLLPFLIYNFSFLSLTFSNDSFHYPLFLSLFSFFPFCLAFPFFQGNGGECIIYPCNQCEYNSNSSKNLKHHINVKHKALNSTLSFNYVHFHSFHSFSVV